uniref:Uncharacterized protein n=1 Tax=viral metagenome TaxID=1070528 RepID=A0A6C0JS12_9ZZZZ
MIYFQVFLTNLFKKMITKLYSSFVCEKIEDVYYFPIVLKDRDVIIPIKMKNSILPWSYIEKFQKDNLVFGLQKEKVCKILRFIFYFKIGLPTEFTVPVINNRSFEREEINVKDIIETL